MFLLSEPSNIIEELPSNSGSPFILQLEGVIFTFKSFK